MNIEKIGDFVIRDKIRETINSIVFHGKTSQSGEPVIIKLLKTRYPSQSELVRFKQEYDVIKNLDIEGVIKVIALVEENNLIAIIEEDIQGIAMKDVIKTKSLDLPRFLEIAVKLAEILGNLHSNNIVHMDIKPANILMSMNDNGIKITDFGISALLTHASKELYNPDVILGTLAYISPEQTGRMNRGLDYRTDLYSLGVTFYEMLTGKLPYSTNDPMELIHSHLARKPVAPHKLNAGIPGQVSRIILKLMAKTTDERYQNSFTLMKDLNICREMIIAGGEISEFPLAANDIPVKYNIPQAITGREKEIEEMMLYFRKVCTGTCEFMIVKGEPGIGKSVLVNEIQKPVVAKRGYYITGKYEQFGKDVPYSALIQALSALVLQIVSEDKTRINSWKERLLTALGNTCKIIFDMLPELELITGPQPELPDIPGDRIKVDLIFRKFISIFTSPDHPLTIFLDDLQWADLASLDLIKKIITSGKMKYLFLIGAHRKVGQHHTLSMILEEIRNTGYEPACISLGPLDVENTNEIITHTLGCESEKSLPLTKLVYRKTAGNPFFINRFMKNLYDNDVLKLDYKTGWKWDLAGIEKMIITENVVDLMAVHIKTMDRNVQDLLKICACIGSHFDPESLSVITGKSIAEVLDSINPAVDEGLVSISGDEYTFQHDRIREAVYSLIPGDQKERIHFEIGKNALEKTSAEELEKNLFYLTDHLNRGVRLISGKKERLELMELNIQAALKAKKEFAFAAAVEYFEKAKVLLSEEEWREQPESFFELSLNLAESLFFSGNNEKAMDICEYLLEIEQNPLEKSSVYLLKTKIIDFDGKPRDEVLAEISKGLKLLGMKLPENARIMKWQILKNIVKMQIYLKRNSVEDLLLLPDMKDKKKIKALRLLFAAIPPAIQHNPPLYILIVLIMFNMTTSFGLTAESVIGFLNCGIIQGAMLGKYDIGYRLSKAAYALINKTKSDYLMTVFYFIFSTYISHWRVHYRESLEYFDQAWKSGLETGDLTYQLFSILHKIFRLLYTGSNLDKCLTMVEETALYCKRAKASIHERVSHIISHTIRKLKMVHNNENTIEFEKEENSLLEETKALNEDLGLLLIGQCNTMVYYFLSDLEKAGKWNDFTEQFLRAGIGLFTLPDHYLFQSLILIEKLKITKAGKQSAVMKKLLHNRKKLKLWSEHCPANFAHKYHLLCAEIAVIKTRSFESIMEYYQKALDAIGTGDFIHMRALIHEHQAKFWIEKGCKLIAKGFIKEAFALYKKWGASAKIKQLEEKYPVFIFETFQEMVMQESGVDTGWKGSPGSGTLNSLNLDLSTIMKSSESLLSEIDISKLLRIIMKLSIENAGAQKGFLILENKDNKNLYIEAGSNIDKEIVILHSIPIDEALNLSSVVVKYVHKTKEPVVLHDACNEGKFTKDTYVIKNKPKSILCAPIINQGKLTGILYLENNLSKGAFTQERLSILKILSSQMAISIENAKLYENLEGKVRERTLQLDKANQKLKELSLQDPLTNLRNRRYIYEFVLKASSFFLESYEKSANQVEKRNININIKSIVFGVYMIDIDYFKKVNDMYGHQAGDTVLIALSDVLKKMIRENDTIVRWGGEEFLIILQNTRVDYLKTFSRKILEVVRDISFKLNDNMVIHKTCSIGCSKIPLTSNHPKLLNLEHTINLSDFALYMAKENGRNKAAHIELRNNIVLDQEIKQYLITLSKNIPVNEKYILLEFVE